MDVIGYQIFIVATLLITYYIKREWVIFACLAWSIETVLLLGYPPLILIQLCVIWGTWYLLNKYRGLKSKNENQIKKINKLNKVIQKYISNKPKIIQYIAHDIPERNIRPLHGNKHKQLLIDSIKEANTTLVILSGWINQYVVDQALLGYFKDALSRGTKIYIGYGWQNFKGIHEDSESSRLAIEKLNLLVREYPMSLFLGKFANHEKILIKDFDYVVYGSNNWLSNNKFRNSERSIILNSPQLAMNEQQRVIKLIKENKIQFYGSA